MKIFYTQSIKNWFIQVNNIRLVGRGIVLKTLFHNAKLRCHSKRIFPREIVLYPIATPAKPEIGAVVCSPQFQNSKTAITYCTVCTNFVVILEKLSVVHKSQYRAPFKCTLIWHELQFRSTITRL